MSDERVLLEGKCVMKANKARLIEFVNARGLIDEKWFPTSQIQDAELLPDGTVRMTIPQWLAEDRGLV